MEENLIGLAGADGRKLMAVVRTARLAVKSRVRHVRGEFPARGLAVASSDCGFAYP